MKKNIFGIITSQLIGGFLGFFGVGLSLFGDGTQEERLVLVAVVLFIYLIVSFVLGITFPWHSLLWGLLVSLLAIIVITMFMFAQFNMYLVYYLLLILGISMGGATLGSMLGKKIVEKMNEESDDTLE